MTHILLAEKQTAKTDLKLKLALRKDFEVVTKWLCEHYMVLNSSKCHFMCLEQNADETFVYNNNEIKNRKEQKILGVTTDNKCRCKIHVKNLRKKA